LAPADGSSHGKRDGGSLIGSDFRPKIEEALSQAKGTDFAIAFLDLHSDSPSSEIACRYERGPAAHKRIEYQGALIGKGGDEPGDHLKWFLTGVVNARFALPGEDVAYRGFGTARISLCEEIRRFVLILAEYPRPRLLFTQRM